MMGAFAGPSLLADTAATLESFVWAFTSIFILLIFLWVLMGWIRIPYSRWSARVQESLDEVVRPYVRLFRFLPTLGPFDLSPIVAVVALLVGANIVIFLIGAIL